MHPTHYISTNRAAIKLDTTNAIYPTDLVPLTCNKKLKVYDSVSGAGTDYTYLYKDKDGAPNNEDYIQVLHSVNMSIVTASAGNYGFTVFSSIDEALNNTKPILTVFRSLGANESDTIFVDFSKGLPLFPTNRSWRNQSVIVDTFLTPAYRNVASRSNARDSDEAVNLDGDDYDGKELSVACIRPTWPAAYAGNSTITVSYSYARLADLIQC